MSLLMEAHYFLALCPLLKVVHSSRVLMQLHLLLSTLSTHKSGALIKSAVATLFNDSSIF